MMTEEWRDVRGFEAYYEVSNTGRLRSKDRRTPNSLTGGTSLVKGRDVRGKINKGGYRQVTLCVKQRNTTRLVHRLVAEAFQPNPLGHRVVRHLNGDPSDNRAENLRWGTYSDNAQDIIRHGRNHLLNRSSCAKGHPYTPENTRRDAGARRCMTCVRDKARRRYWRLRNEELEARRALGLPEATPRPRCRACGQFTSPEHDCRQAMKEDDDE